MVGMPTMRRDDTDGEIQDAIDASYAEVVSRLPRARRPA